MTAAVAAPDRPVLPLAQGKFSIGLVQKAKSAPLQPGASVEFVGTDSKGVPRALGIQGFVLGTKSNVVFVEVTLKDAARLVHARETGTLKIRQTHAPDAGQLADRRVAAALKAPVTIAPRMRTVTVSVTVPASTVETWAPGSVLIFPDAASEAFWSWEDGASVKKSRLRDVRAIFVAAENAAALNFDLTVILDPDVALSVLQASARRQLTVLDRAETMVELARDTRCYITHRRGTETYRIEIPCTD